MCINELLYQIKSQQVLKLIKQAKRTGVAILGGLAITYCATKPTQPQTVHNASEIFNSYEPNLAPKLAPKDGTLVYKNPFLKERIDSRSPLKTPVYTRLPQQKLGNDSIMI